MKSLNFLNMGIMGIPNWEGKKKKKGKLFRNEKKNFFILKIFFLKFLNYI